MIKALIDNSANLQYIITLASCGMQEGSTQSRPVSERLERLIAYIDARNSLSWQKLDPIRLLPDFISNLISTAGHLVCYTEHSVLIYRPPSRLRGVTERTWRHDFDFPGYYIILVGIEPEEDLLLLETRSVDPGLKEFVNQVVDSGILANNGC
jgi:hypothetical protein